MKKNVAILVLALLVVALAYALFFRRGAAGQLGEEAGQPIDAEKPRVEVSFDYGRQNGMASNQFAVWIADAGGKLVKTLLVTDFTAGKGGWAYRKESLPLWVAESGIADMTQEQIDAVTGATPATSRALRLVWYGDDAAGRAAPAGVYTVVIEATLRGPNSVLYKAQVDLTGDAAEVKPAPEFSGTSTAERGMVTNVAVRWVPGT